MTPEEQRDNLLQAALEYINAVNNHVPPVEFADVRAARERLENVAFKVAHEVRGACGGPMAKPKKPKSDECLLPAFSPIYIILCKSGHPHPGYGPRPTYEEAQEAIQKILEAPFTAESYQSLDCCPHRVQAYRPMV